MIRLLLASLLVAPAAAAPQPSAPEAQGRRYVNATVRTSFRDRWDISDYQGKVWLNVSSFGNSVNFNGRPISGSLFGGGNSYSLSGGSVSGQIHRWGNGMDVNVTVYGNPGTRWLNFTVNANGPMNDPRWLPSLSVYSGDASLNFSSLGNREYSVSGSIDDTRFGDEGLAVACLAATLILKEHQSAQGNGLPKADWLEKNRVGAALLKPGLFR